MSFLLFFSEKLIGLWHRQIMSILFVMWLLVPIYLFVSHGHGQSLKENKHVFSPHFCTICQTNDSLRRRLTDRTFVINNKIESDGGLSIHHNLCCQPTSLRHLSFMKASVIDKGRFFSYKARDESLFGTNCFTRLRWQALFRTFCLLW